MENFADKVYRYAGAAGRTSGSQAAAASFALAAGDTNPQGIADPSPASDAGSTIDPAGSLLTAPVVGAPVSSAASAAPAPATLATPVIGHAGASTDSPQSALYWVAPDEYDFAPIDVSVAERHHRV